MNDPDPPRPGRASEVLVVDDHPLVAVALTTALRRQGLTASWREPAATEALHVALAATGPGLLVLDLDLGAGPEGRRDGAALIPAACGAGWRVLVCTGSTERHRIARALAGGAVGWVAKTRPFEELIATIEAVARGEQVFDPVLRAELVAEHRANDRDRARLEALVGRLTPRERAVLDRLAAGRRAAGIAGEFVVSVATVRTQIRSILAKLEVSSQLEAVALARRLAEWDG